MYESMRVPYSTKNVQLEPRAPCPASAGFRVQYCTHSVEFKLGIRN